ncbi:MAG TPA: PH domain-containing protein [Nocardioidaceae bacterium]|nr:PH domain-containing protein [Nocardioidaceae bacterium]
MTDKPYRRLSPLTPLARSFIFVAAVLATTWRDVLRGDPGPLAWVLLALVVAGLVYGGASWLRTKYWIEADELRVDTGVISRQSRRIRIDRLQGIDIVQPFVARLFGLAELRMDVAGGRAREGSLAFLTLGDARELKDVLLARRDAVRAGAEQSTRQAEGTTDVATEPAAPDRLLARVDLGMLVVSILLSPETAALLLTALGFAAVFFVTGQWLGFSAMVPVLGGIVLVQFKKLSGNYNFTVSETPAGMQVRRGLFDLSSQTIALPRLQGVVVAEPVLWRLLGWARLDVSIAGYASSGDNNGPAASTVLPVGHRDLVMRLTRHVLDGVDPDRTPVTAPPEEAQWVAPVGRHFMAAGADPRVVVSREGWLTRRTHVVPHARVQSLRISQGPWQRMLGLADLHVDSPPGPVDVRARHRYAAEARHLLEQEAVVSRTARRVVDGKDPDRPGQGSGTLIPGVADTIQ